MAFFKKIFGNRDKGVNCTDNSDGTKTCVRYENDGSNKLATGSEMTLQIDPSTCKVYPVGNMALNDEEMEDFDKVAKMMETQCRNGVKSG